jgi:hypothetical protein
MSLSVMNYCSYRDASLSSFWRRCLRPLVESIVCTFLYATRISGPVLLGMGLACT